MAQNKLKTIRKLPENGIAIFSGEETSEEIIPPLPIKTNYYRCDKLFHTEIIKPLFETHDVYGYLSITDKVILFTTNGSTVSIISKINFDLATDTGRGGQSANRLHRIRMEKREILKKNIVDMVISSVLRTEGENKFESLIISGCAEMPKEVKEMLESDTRFNKPILGIVKIAGKDVISETIEEGKKLIEYKSVDDEKKHILDIETLMRVDSERLVFGMENIMRCIYEKKLEKVYIENKGDELGNLKPIVLSQTGYLKKFRSAHDQREFDGVLGVMWNGIQSENCE